MNYIMISFCNLRRALRVQLKRLTALQGATVLKELNLASKPPEYFSITLATLLLTVSPLASI